MSVDADLDRVARLLVDGDPREAGRLLTQIYSEARPGAYEGCVKRMAHDDPSIGARFAICAGAFIESGHDARVLARAIEAPLLRALELAIHFAAWADGAPPAADDDDTAIDVGPRKVARAAVDAFTNKSAENAEAAAAFFSLGTWYRPAVASWTRDIDTLREVQRHGRVLAAASPLVGVGEGMHWIEMVVKTMFDAELIVLIPEIDEAWSLRLHGVTDIGQLTLLISDPLHASLLQIDASGRAEPDVLAVARGDAEQQLEATYGCSFHLYSWESLDPGTRQPRDGRFVWRAPGGTGEHSLPPDFLPGDLAPLDEETRVVALVGPRVPGVRFTRVIPAVRSFGALRARVDATRMSRADAARWFQTALDASARRKA